MLIRPPDVIAPGAACGNTLRSERISAEAIAIILGSSCAYLERAPSPVVNLQVGAPAAGPAECRSYSHMGWAGDRRTESAALPDHHPGGRGTEREPEPDPGHADRLLKVQVAVPVNPPANPYSFGVQAMRDAIDAAQAWSERRSIDFDPSRLRSLVALVEEK